MAKTEPKKDAKPKGGSTMGLIASVLGLTVLAAGGGALIGTQIMALAKADDSQAHKVEAGKPASTLTVRELPPIVANLAAPEGVWVRLQTAIVYDKADVQPIDITAARIVEDTVAYVKTLSVTQLQGAIGLEHLREDLNDRVALRSEGRVKEVMIEALVIE